METVTISKAEYEEFQALKQQNADLQQRVDFLMAQMRLARHKQFGSSSEKSEYDQLSLFDEAEVYADPKKSEPEITEVKPITGRRQRKARNVYQKTFPSRSWNIPSRRKNESVRNAERF